MVTTGSALAAVGVNGDLVGREVAQFEIGTDSGYTATIDQQAQFAELPTGQGEMPSPSPARSTGPDEPPELLVAVNGRFAGVIGGYVADGAGWTFIGYLADLYRVGSNDVAVYEARRTGDDVSLHPVGPRDRLSAGGTGRSCAFRSAALGARR